MTLLLKLLPVLLLLLVLGGTHAAQYDTVRDSAVDLDGLDPSSFVKTYFDMPGVDASTDVLGQIFVQLQVSAAPPVKAIPVVGSATSPAADPGPFPAALPTLDDRTVSALPIEFPGNAAAIATFTGAAMWSAQNPDAVLTIWAFGSGMSLTTTPYRGATRGAPSPGPQTFPVDNHVAILITRGGVPFAFDPIMHPQDGKNILNALVDLPTWFSGLSGVSSVYVCGATSTIPDGPCFDSTWIGPDHVQTRLSFFETIRSKLQTQEDTWRQSGTATNLIQGDMKTLSLQMQCEDSSNCQIEPDFSDNEGSDPPSCSASLSARASAESHRIRLARRAVPSNVLPNRVAYADITAAGGLGVLSTACPTHFLNGRAPELGADFWQNSVRDLSTHNFRLLCKGSTNHVPVLALVYDSTFLSPVIAAFSLEPGLVKADSLKRKSDSWKMEQVISERHGDRLTKGEQPHSKTLAVNGWREYNRGHLVANAFRSYDQELSKATFSTWNMFPQESSVNSGGLWFQIEYRAKQLAKAAAGTVYGFAGTWFDPRTGVTGMAGGNPGPFSLAIPSASWMALCDSTNGQAGAWWAPNAPSSPPFYFHSLRFIEQKLGPNVHLYPNSNCQQQVSPDTISAWFRPGDSWVLAWTTVDVGSRVYEVLDEATKVWSAVTQRPSGLDAQVTSDMSTQRWVFGCDAVGSVRFFSIIFKAVEYRMLFGGALAASCQ
ncbi:hypothetical protein HDU87_000854 [Geranomyces variabilis]|uniref:DNA/RNA non-specific endonuclease domain-containing protein n=1 Tax=Geranomyces variabilis TaxID=109894 RepID=A0AAD5XLL8_9FUNG|nr:hypothetical protein HDU87_000854 [Geranomyces variabilis]